MAGGQGKNVKAIKSAFMILCWLGLLAGGMARADSPGAWEQQDELAQMKAEVLGQIDYLNHTLDQHDNSGEVTHLFSLASTIAVSLVDGSLSTLFTRMMSAVMTQENGYWHATSMTGFYTSMAMALSYELMRMTRHGHHLDVYSHIQYSMEAMGAGQLFGLLAFSVSNTGMEKLKEDYGAKWWMRWVSRDFPENSGFSSTAQLRYDSATHYLFAHFVMSALYYFVRAGDYGLRVQKKLVLVREDLSRAREALDRIEDEQRGILRGIRRAAGEPGENVTETDLETDYPHFQDQTHRAQNLPHPAFEEDLHPEEFDPLEEDQG